MGHTCARITPEKDAGPLHPSPLSPGNASPVTTAGYDSLLARTSAQLQHMSGVPDAGIKQQFLASRVAEAMATRGESSLSCLLERAENGEAAARAELRNLLTINYSCFWREAEHWPILEEHLCLRIRSGTPTRLWSAACARGEEAWTMALVAEDVSKSFAATTPGWEWTVLATDIDLRSLDGAATGRYTERELASLPERLHRHLQPAGTALAPRWDIPDALRSRVSFRPLDLARADWEPPCEAPFDAIFLCNVLIYLDRVTQERVLRNVASCLRPDGILFTSRIEGNLGLATSHLKAAGPCTYILARTARTP